MKMTAESQPNLHYGDMSQYTIAAPTELPPLHMDRIKETIVELKKGSRIYVRNEFGHLIEITGREESLVVRNLTKDPCTYKSTNVPRLILTDNKPRESFRGLTLISGELADEA